MKLNSLVSSMRGFIPSDRQIVAALLDHLLGFLAIPRQINCVMLGIETTVEKRS
jgi:hypothetical protein